MKENHIITEKSYNYGKPYKHVNELTDSSIFLLIQYIFAESSPGIFMDSSNFADTAYFADSTNE